MGNDIEFTGEIDADAAEFFAARLAYQTDVADVHAAIEAGGVGRTAGFVLVDARGSEAWRQGRLPGAVHVPTREIPDRAGEVLDRAVPVVTYCWGPGCNGATRAALALARLGYRVREMIGGYEYWVREGFPVETDGGRERRAADPLTAPVGAACGC